jgi:hypothetical protein
MENPTSSVEFWSIVTMTIATALFGINIKYGRKAAKRQNPRFIKKKLKYIIINYCCYGIFFFLSIMLILELIHTRAHVKSPIQPVAPEKDEALSGSNILSAKKDMPVWGKQFLPEAVTFSNQQTFRDFTPNNIFDDTITIVVSQTSDFDNFTSAIDGLLMLEYEVFSNNFEIQNNQLDMELQQTIDEMFAEMESQLMMDLEIDPQINEISEEEFNQLLDVYLTQENFLDMEGFDVELSQLENLDDLFWPIEERQEGHRNLREVDDETRHHKKNKKHDKKDGKKLGKNHGKEKRKHHKKRHDREEKEYHEEFEALPMPLPHPQKKIDSSNAYSQDFEDIKFIESSPDHEYNVEEAQEDFLFAMFVIWFFDMLSITLFITRFMKLRSVLTGKKETKAKPKRSGKKQKKAKKTKKRVEEAKEVHADEKENPSYGFDEENPNNNLDSDTELIKSSREVPSQAPPQLHMPISHGQTVVVNGKTFIAMKVSEFDNLQRASTQLRGQCQI